MTFGTGIVINRRTGERIGAIHLGDGKLRGAAYFAPDPIPGNRHNRKRVTAREAHRKLMAFNSDLTIDAVEDIPLEEGEADTADTEADDGTDATT